MNTRKAAESKTIFKCDNCDYQIKRGMKHCPNCGAGLFWDNEEEKPKVEYCSNCGNKVKSGEKFCTECGAAIGSTEPEEDMVTSKTRKEFKVPYVVKLGLIFGGIYLLKGLFLDDHQYDTLAQFSGRILGDVSCGLILGSLIGLIVDHIKKAKNK